MNVYQIRKEITKLGVLAVSHVQEHVRRLHGLYFLPSEVSRGLGIPLQTLQMWARDQQNPVGPSKKTLYRGKWVYLYTQNDVERVRELRESRVSARPAMQSGGPGRLKMWSEAEKAERNRRNRLAVYYSRRAQALEARGEPDLAAAYAALATKVRSELRQQAEDRRREHAQRVF